MKVALLWKEKLAVVRVVVFPAAVAGRAARSTVELWQSNEHDERLARERQHGTRGHEK